VSCPFFFYTHLFSCISWCLSMRGWALCGTTLWFLLCPLFILNWVASPHWTLCCILLLLSHHLCMSVVWGLFFPVSESVLLALSLELLAPSIHQATPGPPFVYPASSRSSSVVSTPWLDPSYPATTFYGALPESWQSIQTLGLSQGKSSMCWSKWFWIFERYRANTSLFTFFVFGYVVLLKEVYRVAPHFPTL
jgi:hypothetical protein